MPGDDPVELARLFGLADREERLDPTLRADGLHPDVVSLVDERQAEAGAVGPGGAQLLPDAFGAGRGGARRRGQRDAVQVQEHRPPLGHVGERRRDPLDPRTVHHGAREDVLRVDRSLQHVVLLGEDPREHRLGDRDERHRVRHLEHRERDLVGRGDDRPRHLVVGEPESEPEPREAGVGQALDVRTLLRRRRADAHPGREEQLAALQPRRRVLELAHVDPPDRADRVWASPATRRSAMPGISRMSRTLTRHGAIVRVVQSGAVGCDDRARVVWTVRTTPRSAWVRSEAGEGSLDERHSVCPSRSRATPTRRTHGGHPAGAQGPDPDPRTEVEGVDGTARRRDDVRVPGDPSRS